MDYLPPVLREVVDFQAVNGANEPEISMAWDALAMVLANQFLETADARGVSVWEKELKIFPRDTDSLEIRKIRIKAMWNRETPYTLSWLRDWLDGICGPDGHTETLEDYTLHVKLDHTARPNTGNLLAEILDMLAEVRPANIRLFLEDILRFQGALHFGGVVSSVSTLPVPEAVDNLKWLDKFRMGGTMAIHSVLPVPEKI